MPVTPHYDMTEQQVRNLFEDRLSRTPKVWERFVERIMSNSRVERYRWLGALPTMRRFGTGLQTEGGITEQYDVANEKYAVAVEVDRDDLDDDQTGSLQRWINFLGQRAAQHPMSLLTGLIVNGATAGFVGYDGSTFFASDHASGGSGDQDNTTTSVTANDDVDLFTAAEAKLSLRLMQAQLESFVDDKGEPIYFSTDSGLVIVCNPTQKQVWQEVAGAIILNNTTNILAGTYDVVSLPGITAGKSYLFKTDEIVKPFVYQEKDAITLEQLGPGSPDWIKQEKALYKARGRYSLAYAEWKMAIQHTWTT